MFHHEAIETAAGGALQCPRWRQAAMQAPGVLIRSKFAVVSAIIVALGVAASPALATDGFSLQFSAGSDAASAGKPVVLSVVGKNPGWADYPYATYLDADVFLPAAVPTCPATRDAAGQLASATGGANVAFDTQVNSDPAGNFSIPVGFTPLDSGPLLVCGYTTGLAGETLATAALTVNVKSASPAPAPPTPAPPTPAPPTPAAAKPASVTAPRLTRSGNRLTCHAGNWSNAPTRFSYRWLVDAKATRGTSGRALTITRKLRRHTLQCQVTGSNAAGNSTALSNPLTLR